jgi:hypothetical protein
VLSLLWELSLTGPTTVSLLSLSLGLVGAQDVVPRRGDLDTGHLESVHCAALQQKDAGDERGVLAEYDVGESIGRLMARISTELLVGIGQRHFG